MNEQLVLLTWNDAWADTDGFATMHGIAQTHHPMVIQTIGWLLQDDETGVSLANERSSADGTETFRGRTFVPRLMVVSVTPFKMTKPRMPRTPKMAAGDVAIDYK